MTTQPLLCRRHRFPAEIISHAVWLYHLFSLSLRDIALILAERGVVITTKASATGAAGSMLSSPDDCADGDRDRGIPGIWKRLLSA
jgi:hypothetical protein